MSILRSAWVRTPKAVALDREWKLISLYGRSVTWKTMKPMPEHRRPAGSFGPGSLPSRQIANMERIQKKLRAPLDAICGAHNGLLTAPGGPSDSENNSASAGTPAPV